jgi:uncharacterized protein
LVEKTQGYGVYCKHPTGKDVIPVEITISEDISSEYFGLVRNILEHDEFRKLIHYKQHYGTTRFMHSLNVSYLSWSMARRLGFDESVAARAGLLHDFCVYDFKEKLPKGEIQAFYHPKVAAKTSGEHFDLYEIERQAILSHMFPLGPLPKSREAWLISCMDKFCACTEFFRVKVALSRRDRVTICAAAS